MGNNWPTVTIEAIQANKKGAIAIGPFGSRLKSDNYVEVGIPVIRGTNLTGGKKLTGNFVFITEEKADSLGSSNVYQNDLVFPHRGSIGEVGIILDNERYVLSSSLMKLSVDIDKVNPLYLYYFFRSSIGRHELLKNASQVGTPGIGQPLSSLKGIEFKNPPLDIQNKIAEILSELDNKLTLNHQINQTLEQMAQALFKSWFVDFDPVVDNALDAGFFEQDLAFPDELLRRAEARRAVREHSDFKPLPEATRQLFPAAFEECVEPSLSLGGWVPQGWNIAQLSKVAKVATGKRPPSKGTQKTKDEPIPVWGGNGIKWFTNVALTHDKHIITGRVGTLGTVYKVNGPSWASDNSLVIRPLKNSFYEFVFQTLSLFDINSLNSGSTQPLVTQTALNGIKCIFPNNDKLLVDFQMLADGYDSKMALTTQETATLTQLRDFLLPKLMSGEVNLEGHL